MPPLLTVPATVLAQTSALPPIGGTGQWLVYGLVLLAVAAALFFIEVFLPTGGLVAVMAGLSAVAGVFCLFRINTTLGIIGATVVLMATPVLLVLAIKIWPDTPFGQWVTHSNEPKPSQGTSAQPHPQPHPHDASADDHASASLQPGDTGHTLTPLRPVGVCMLNGRRHECLARSGSIDPDVQIEVVSVTGHDVYVRPADTAQP